ncbi:MAG TPA: sulfatase, partial [Opitutae bacterium]|nr:sulfatase [Opitutae bacterium]
MPRRNFLQRFGGGLGGLALANMLHAESGQSLHHPAKAKRVIYLFQSGGPSQIDLFDHKPSLKEETGKEL